MPLTVRRTAGGAVIERRANRPELRYALCHTALGLGAGADVPIAAAERTVQLVRSAGSWSLDGGPLGDRIDLGGRVLEALHTPGHASHHVALADGATGAVFTGDALGIHLPDLPVLRPATPPPDFDLERSLESIERIRSRARGSFVLFSHFGPVREVERICDLAARRTRAWTETVREALRRTDDVEEIVALLEAEARRDVATGAEAELDLDRFELLSGVRMNALGIIRYWRTRAEAEGERAQPES